MTRLPVVDRLYRAARDAGEHHKAFLLYGISYIVATGRVWHRTIDAIAALDERAVDAVVDRMNDEEIMPNDVARAINAGRFDDILGKEHRRAI